MNRLISTFMLLAFAINLSAQTPDFPFRTPNINIFRDPRWGRGQETYGEDPFLTAEMGKAAVNGEPCCSSDALLVDILREKWNYQGMVVSDCGAIGDFYHNNAHATHPNASSASADAVITGTDVECGSSYASLSEAVEKGYIREADIDIAMQRIIKGWIDLGMLDEKDNTPWADLPYSIVASEEHTRQALNAARKSIVLLKNDNVLPLKPEKTKRIAVIGPNAADGLVEKAGDYSILVGSSSSDEDLKAIKLSIKQ